MIRAVIFNYINQNAEDLAISNISAWANRYAGYSLDDLEWDLKVNNDFSPDFEEIEDNTKTKMNDDEKHYFIGLFIKYAKSNFKYVMQKTLNPRGI